MSGRRYVTVSHESGRWGESTIGVSNAPMLDIWYQIALTGDQSPFHHVEHQVIRGDNKSNCSRARISSLLIIKFYSSFHPEMKKKNAIAVDRIFNIREHDCASFFPSETISDDNAAYLLVIANVCAEKSASIRKQNCSRLTPLQTHSLLYTLFFFTATIGGGGTGGAIGECIVVAVEREIKFAPQTRFSPAISRYRKHGRLTNSQLRFRTNRSV